MRWPPSGIPSRPGTASCVGRDWRRFSSRRWCALLVRAGQHRGVDQVLLVVVAILARGTALAELPAGRRLVGQRAARQIQRGLLPPFGVLEAIVIEVELHRLLLRGPELDRRVDALPPPVQFVEEERLILRHVLAVVTAPAVGDAEQLRLVAASRVARRRPRRPTCAVAEHAPEVEALPVNGARPLMSLYPVRSEPNRNPPGMSNALSVSMLIEAPIALASMSGRTALTTSRREIRSAGTASIDTPRVPNSAGVPITWPLRVTLFKLASMPRTTTKRPSPDRFPSTRRGRGEALPRHWHRGIGPPSPPTPRP